MHKEQNYFNLQNNLILMCDTIFKYFPNLKEEQKNQFRQLMKLYPEWNEKINVISRKDIDNLEINHLLHSLAIAKFINFVPGTKILDLGSGGGLPGIPLAILFPEVHFHLIDRTGKKMTVAMDIAEKTGLKNVTVQHGDVAECKQKFDFIINRGVMPQDEILKVSRKNIDPIQKNAIPNGIISLKGGEIGKEIKSLKSSTETVDISGFFNEPFFNKKKIVYTMI